MSYSPQYPDPVPSPDAIVDVLVAAGVRYVFGLSGGHTGKIFGALEKRQDAIQTVLVREESLGAIMAETVGRMTGVPGVLLGQGPWILGNGMVGTIEARLSSSPLLLMTDFTDTPPFSLHAPYQSGTGEYGGWDARAAFRGVAKEVFSADEPNPAVIATQLALKHALTGQPGPVAVIYGARALSGMAGGDALPRIYPAPPFVARAEPAVPPMDKALQALTKAKRPLVIAGNGVRLGGAEQALEAFANAWGAVVVTSPAGKGVFNEASPLSAGTIGAYGNPTAHRALGQADLVLAVGTKLSASDTVGADPALVDPSRQVIVQIDIEPRNLSWTLPVDHTLAGDAGTILQQLALAVPDERESGNWFSTTAPRAVAYPKSTQPGAMHAPEIISALQAHLPPDTIFTCDAGENRIFMMHYFQARGTGRFSQPAGAGPMGYAIPSAVAQKLLNPQTTVVAFAGDGGFSMTMNGLMTAIEAQAPIIAVVMNNHALGWSQHSRGPFATSFEEFDYAAIARGMGCGGRKVTGAVGLVEALAEAQEAVAATGRPFVIDVETSMDFSFASLSFANTRHLE
ncbi:thiamine pyrophosphate-binding protein [Tianweitania sediminis]|uniref:Thiamine pyrophosphate-binding protein n=1 Tax=Tianweitania sediminis TaxID=1502156 RepID=A0A8J7QXN7_9HYPH|nr:thiamine pyrophosphate-binding protein [Tianweitania sediminis]MBP0437705.1 thiamine pyrophosphate-binding protein [Tianweitania sediminis]